ncbi:MAG: mechanosensitive ion channel domain-containing protein, partial [Gemmatimonadota bacterium]
DLTLSVVTSAGLAYGNALGRLVQTAVVLVAVAVAIEQVGIDIQFLTTASVVTLGVLLFGAALAFGLGARTTVSNILAAHYLRRTYTVGQTVRIGELKGEIVQITATAVILRSAEGRALVPAKVFSETITVLVVRET